MAPIKFEEHIKEKLDGREIKPSSNAWNKIANEVGITSNAKKRKFGTWYAIAACLIGLLIGFIVFLNYLSETVVSEIQLVETPKQEVNEKNDIFEKQVFEQEIVVSDVTVGNDNEEKSKLGSVTATEKINDKKLNLVNVNDVEVAETFTTENQKDILLKTESLAESEQLINAKIYELVAKVDSLELNTNTVVTDIEVDALLRKAQNEILEQKIFKGNQVDAMALLTEVENELDLSVRDQLFDKLKNGYLKVKTALADRNN